MHIDVTVLYTLHYSYDGKGCRNGISRLRISEIYDNYTSE